jgi:hypothetical protein
MEALSPTASYMYRTGNQTHDGPEATREECIVLRRSEAAIHAAGISEQVTIKVRCITLQVLLFMHLQKTLMFRTGKVL